MSALFLSVCCLLSTSLMTLFSYCAAQVLQKQFREPEILNTLGIRMNIIRKTAGKNHLFGWVIHYAVGLFFIVLVEYTRIWAQIEPFLLYYILSGAFCGLVGVAVWFTTFTLHPNPPLLHYSAFYFQLIFAHMIFGFGIWVSILIFSS